jgi:hypothetical protein
MTSEDFEVNETGTIKQLNLHTMTLRAALDYIDGQGIQIHHGIVSIILDGADVARRQTLDTLRGQLGPEFQLTDDD